MVKKLIVIISVFTIIILAADISNIFAQGLPMVNSIEVRGLKRIEEGAVKAKITHKTGESLANEKTTNDIKNIYKMGYFDDVSVEVEPFEGGVKLIYLIREKPTIIKLDFQGNDEFEDAKLKEKITVTAGAIADTVLIQDNAEKLHSFYEEEGYWLAKVVPVIKRVNDDEVTLTYQIDEGPKIKIKDVVIEGNKEISKKEIKKAIKTTDWWIFSFITSSGYYKKAEMNSDVEKIKDLYYNKGFINIAVSEPKIELNKGKDRMVITITVSEGKQYKVASVNITGYKAYKEEELKPLIELKANDVFNRRILRQDINELTEAYSEKGYALASVSPEVLPDDSKLNVKITYKIEEGAVYNIGRIEISGNTKTIDKVIRREVRLDEGDKFNSKLLKRSYERITNLQYFETVDLVPKPKQEEKVLDVDIKVKERPTGSISVGGGYSSVDGAMGMFDVTQGNLFGRGQYIRLRSELGTRVTYYELAFRDPWFMDKPISFGASIYRTTRQYGQYDKKATGFDVSFGKDFSEYVKGSITYNFENADISNIDPDASELVKEQQGKKITSSITPGLVRDSRDNYLDPHKGSKNAFYVTYAGVGGDNYFVKVNLDSAWFFPIYDNTFSIRGRYGFGEGVNGKKLPLYERYYVGGIYTIRGLGFGEGGPKDSSGDPMGGKQQILFNTEFIYPLISELKLKGLVFFDSGMAYDSLKEAELRYTTGLGFRWISPVGPLRIEWGYNLKPKEGEGKSRFEFTIGSFF
ncbi:MAG: outer membrane protein assembly factor BamA [Nitrospiraceae bacterium]|nr:outer membrane protein assembly factor BamA [Nitrospiraceae bacterium]